MGHRARDPQCATRSGSDLLLALSRSFTLSRCHRGEGVDRASFKGNLFNGCDVILDLLARRLVRPSPSRSCLAPAR